MCAFWWWSSESTHISSSSRFCFVNLAKQYINDSPSASAKERKREVIWQWWIIASAAAVAAAVEIFKQGREGENSANYSKTAIPQRELEYGNL